VRSGRLVPDLTKAINSATAAITLMTSHVICSLRLMQAK
jgi:hypothetical protein